MCVCFSRVLVAICFPGYSQCIRERTPDLALQQNLQLGRLCDILGTLRAVGCLCCDYLPLFVSKRMPGEEFPFVLILNVENV